MSNKFRSLFTVFTVIFAIGLCVTIPLVIYLILYEIDPSTYFYYDNAKLVPVLNGILFALTVVLIVPLFIKRAGAAGYSGTTKLPSRKPVIASSSLLLALALCFASSYEIVTSVLSKTIEAGTFLTGVSGLLAAIFFFVFAGILFTGKNSDLRLVALLPVLWGVINLISTFMSLTQVANISQYLYQVLQMVFAILFLYYNARIVGGVSNGREINGAFAFGLPCALFGFLASVPPVIAHLVNRHRGNLPQVKDAVFIVMSIYILVLLISILVKKPMKAGELADEEVVSEVAESSTQEENPEA